MLQAENWYFAYGSNLSKPQMLSRTGSIPPSVAAKLVNYRLAFRRVLDGQGVYATIVPVKGAVVHGVAYRCSLDAILNLDRFEGIAENCYRREMVKVTTQAADELDCIVYIGESFHQADEVPSESYLDLILTGAESHHLPRDYIDSIVKLVR